MTERIDTAVRLLTEMPGYEDIFVYFDQKYKEAVFAVDESEMINEGRRVKWLAEFKQEIDNFNCENSHE